MDNVARLLARDWTELFAAARRGDMRAELIEKDFWVCWTLKRIFTLDPWCGRTPVGSCPGTAWARRRRTPSVRASASWWRC
jgi:hypothetical protein